MILFVIRKRSSPEGLWSSKIASESTSGSCHGTFLARNNSTKDAYYKIRVEVPSDEGAPKGKYRYSHRGDPRTEQVGSVERFAPG